MVVVDTTGTDFHVIDRRRVELVDEDDLRAKQPYHVAEKLGQNEAREVVNNGIESARNFLSIMH